MAGSIPNSLCHPGCFRHLIFFCRAFILNDTTYKLHDCVLVSNDINNTLDEAKVCQLIDLYDTGESITCT